MSERVSEREGSDHRNRFRFRLRAGATAEITDDWKATFQLASGGDDPVSTNQTMDGAFSTKGIQLDIAEISWKRSWAAR